MISLMLCLGLASLPSNVARAEQPARIDVAPFAVGADPFTGGSLDHGAATSLNAEISAILNQMDSPDFRAREAASLRLIAFMARTGILGLVQVQVPTLAGDVAQIVIDTRRAASFLSRLVEIIPETFIEVGFRLRALHEQTFRPLARALELAMRGRRVFDRMGAIGFVGVDLLRMSTLTHLYFSILQSATTTLGVALVIRELHEQLGIVAIAIPPAAFAALLINLHNAFSLHGGMTDTELAENADIVDQIAAQAGVDPR